MKQEELNQIFEQFKSGKILYSQDRTYAYSGDIHATVIRYELSRKVLLWELYELTANGDFCSRSEVIPLENIYTFIEKVINEQN